MTNRRNMPAKPHFLDFGRTPTPGLHHAPMIELVQAYSQITPGTNTGTFLPLVWNRYPDGGEPDYLPIGTAPDARFLYDPAHMVCAGVGDQFWVIRDHYRSVWMPLHPHGLHRHASLGAQLNPGSSAAGSTVSLNDSTGAGAGSIGGQTIYCGHNVGEPIPSGQVVPVFYVSAERKWYVTLTYFDETP